MKEEGELEIEGLDNYEPDTEAEEGSTYEPTSEFKKPLLVMEAVRKCVDARATEMKQGFWNNKLDKRGNAIRTWEADQRKVYIGSVIALRRLLIAECRKDKQFSDSMEEIDKNIDALIEKYSYTEYSFDSKTTGWKKTNDKYIPQIDEEVLMPTPINPNTLTNIRGGWNNKINALYDQLISLYDSLFEELNMVVYRLNDFAMKTSY